MKSGLRLAALYAYGCQKTKELGIDEKLKKFVISGQNEQEIKFYLKKLEPYLYYQLIAMANKIDNPFDQRVVRSYWLGSEILEKIKQDLLKELVGQVDSFHLLRANYLILGGKPQHNFSVLSKIPIKNEETVKMANQCLINWGRVIENTETGLTVFYQPLVLKNRKLTFGNLMMKIIERGLLKRVKINDIVSIHFNEAREILNENNLENLKKYTEEAIEMFN